VFWWVPSSAGGIKLESLLKLNDVKVTAAPSGGAQTPHRRSPSAAEAEETGGPSPGDGADAAGAANGVVAAPPLPPVKTLLEFVAWAALEQEAALLDGADGGGGGLTGEALAQAVRAGFLEQELPQLALAVRRMQTGECTQPAKTEEAGERSAAGRDVVNGPGACRSLLPADVADSMRGLEAGMRNLRHELDAELEQQRLRAAAARNGDGGGDGGDGASTSPAAARQAAFSSELEAAAAAKGGNGNGEPAEMEQEGEQQQGPPASPFAAMLQAFVAEAEARQAGLEEAAQLTSAVVKETIAWLGEAGADPESSVFEVLLSFQTAFDACCKKVHRQMLAAAAAAAGPTRGPDSARRR
jgi:hypothetical protein